MPNRNSTIAEKFPIHLHLYWMRWKEGVVVGSWIILWELIPQSWELAPPPPERHSFLSNFFVNETQYFSLYPFRGRRFWFQILFRSRNIGFFNFLGSNWKMMLLNSSHMELLKQDDEDNVDDNCTCGDVNGAAAADFVLCISIGIGIYTVCCWWWYIYYDEVCVCVSRKIITSFVPELSARHGICQIFYTARFSGHPFYTVKICILWLFLLAIKRQYELVWSFFCWTWNDYVIIQYFFSESVCNFTKWMVKFHIFAKNYKGMRYFLEKIYTAGNFFTRLPVATVVTNFKSAEHKRCQARRLLGLAGCRPALAQWWWWWWWWRW